MKAQAQSDGDVFLPNPEPSKPVDYIFVCMEPSLGRWAGSPGEAREKIDTGFRNFVSSMENSILHFCIRRYLCEREQLYHMTDISKGAMLGKRANVARRERWNRWWPLLKDELDLVGKPDAGIFAVGRPVADYLQRRGRAFTRLIHYSGLAGQARRTAIVGHEAEFEAWKKMNSVSLPDVLATAADVLCEAAIPATFREETLARLATRRLSESEQRLIFAYKLAFEAYRKRREVGAEEGKR
jgi:hypothetical protein